MSAGVIVVPASTDEVFTINLTLYAIDADYRATIDWLLANAVKTQ